MGFFSWLDCKTGEQTKVGVLRPVYVLVPQKYGGGAIIEPCYDGYGNFGGYDIFELFAKWNHCPRKKGIDFRDIGIDVYCDWENDNGVVIQYPIKMTYDQNAIYEQCEPSFSDPLQGCN